MEAVGSLGDQGAQMALSGTLPPEELHCRLFCRPDAALSCRRPALGLLGALCVPHPCLPGTSGLWSCA